MEEERNIGMANNAIVVRRKIVNRRRGLQALWAAIMLHFRIRAPKKAMNTAIREKKEDEIDSSEKNETTWKNIVGSIRPLHLSVSLPPPPPPPFDKDIYHDVSLPPASPESSYDSMSSRYCSVEDLHALDKGSDDTEGAVDEEGESDVINAQAEEFIAKFYEQIRLQRLQSVTDSCSQTENNGEDKIAVAQVS